jgi:EAL domain-containing protein (putative c-di-GMP-specific phosphodiesterase class I)
MKVQEPARIDAPLQTPRDLSCDEAQGVLLGRPMPPDELVKRLATCA